MTTPADSSPARAPSRDVDGEAESARIVAELLDGAGVTPTLYQVINFINECKRKGQAAGQNVSVPKSLQDLVRLPSVFAFFNEQDFWSFSDQALDGGVERARVTGRRAADALFHQLSAQQPRAGEGRGIGDDTDTSPDGPAIRWDLDPQSERRIDRAARDVVEPALRFAEQQRSARNGPLFILRSTTHAAEAEELQDLWTNDHGNDARLAALRKRIFSSDFDAVTDAFIRDHRGDLELLVRCTGRSGPTRPAAGEAGARLSDHGMKRVASINTVTLTGQGIAGDAGEELRLPIDRTGLGDWQLSHPCGCADDKHRFSRSLQVNWQYVDRLFSRFYPVEVLQELDAMLSTTRLITQTKGGQTLLTDVGFTDLAAPIYAVPQVKLNYSYCDRCDAEFLCRLAEGLAQDPSREYPQGLPGRLIVNELIQFRGPANQPFLAYLKDRRLIR